MINIRRALRMIDGNDSEVGHFSRESLADEPQLFSPTRGGGNFSWAAASKPNRVIAASAFESLLLVAFIAYPKRGLTLSGEANKPIKSIRLQRVRPLFG
jgi:hypothetical protein